MLALEQSREELQQRNREVTRELDSTRKDAEGMVQVISSMERQNADFSAREEATMKLAGESKERVEQAMLEMEQAQVRRSRRRQAVL